MSATKKTSAGTIHGPSPKRPASRRNGKSSVPTKEPSRSSNGASGRNGAAPANPVDESQRHIAQEPPTLIALLYECDNDPALGHYDVADRIIAKLRDRDDGWDVIRPVIAGFVNTNRRRSVRIAERAIVRSFVPGDGTQRATSAVRELSLEQLAAFADERINLRRGHQVRAGAVEDVEWDQKIAELDDGIRERQETVDFYRLVRRTLESLGAKSIDAALRGARRGRR